MSQLFLIHPHNPFKLFAPQQGRRKSKRPLSSRHPIHLVLKSKSPDLKRKERAVLKWWNKLSLKFGVKSYQIVVNRDHIHAIVRLHSPRLFIGFLRAVTGTIARCLKVKCGFIDYEPARTRRLPHWLKL